VLAGCIATADDQVPIVVTEPTLIAFFPPASDAKLAASAGLASALDHFGYAYHLTQTCLADSKVTVLLHRALRLSVQTDGRIDEHDLSRNDNESLGCYLAAPAKMPKVVFASAGPSSLIILCPAAAATYFDVPSCCPDGFKCCPDGSVKDESATCDG